MHGRLKGQFFIMGALVICVIFFAALPPAIISGTGNTRDMSLMAENLEREIPRAANLALLDDGSPESLGEFMDFIRESTREKYLGMESLWVVGVPDPDNPGDMAFYSGNWLGRAATVYITADSLGISHVLDDQETGSSTLSGLASSFTLEVSFDGRTWSNTVSRDKATLYCYLSLARGENSVVKDIEG
jgi:hypothetical protein